MKICLRILMLLALSGWDGYVMAQLPGMRKYTQIDGYTASTGYLMNQDEKGYIWIGTDNGGMRFDGKSFRVIRDMEHSPDAEILCCRPLGEGRVLLLPLSGMVNYVDKGVLKTDIEDSSLRRVKTEYNKSYFDPLTGTTWLNDQGRMGLSYGFKGRTIHRYELKKDSVSILMVIHNRLIGHKRFNGTDYLGMYDLKKGTYYYYHDLSGRRLTREHDGAILTSEGDYHYLNTYNGTKKQLNIFKYTPDNALLRLVNTIKIPIRDVSGVPYIKNDEQGGLWMRLAGHGGGIFFYDKITGHDAPSITYHFAEPELTNGFFIDRHNNLWISTPNNALYFLSEKHFRNLLLTSRIPIKKAAPQAISGSEEGGICISYQMLKELTCSWNGKITNIKLNKDFTGGSRHILPMNDSSFIIYDSDIAIANIKNGAISYLDLHTVCKDACLYGDKSLLAATILGLYQVDLPLVKGAAPRLLFDKRATAVDALHNGTILIGTQEGLYIKPSLNTYPSKINHPLLCESNITDILALKNDNALIGTNAKGLFIMSGIDGAIKQIRITHSGDPRYIKRLYRQNDSTYWAATDQGAYSMTFDKKWELVRTRNYTFYDGLPSDNITDVYVSRDTAYFTTMQGLGIIPLKDSSRLQMAPPDMYIDKVSVSDTVYHEPGGTIVLPHNGNELLISLSAISYESLGNIHFYYQLSPFQGGWVETTNPEIRFAGLPPGKYILKAYATNAKGIGSKYATITIEIRPAFWQTIYFKIGLFLLSGALLYFVLRWWIRHKEKEKFEKIQQKKRLAELELEAIKAQINPHFIYNCLNSIKYLNYISERKQTQEYLDAFARLIRMTMDYSRRIFITLQDEIDYLTNYLKLEKLRLKDKLIYDIETGGEIAGIQLPAMLLQPYVENALKHGIASQKEQGHLWIQFRNQDDHLHIFIRDDGPGFSKLKSSDSLGMHLAGTRALSYRELFHLDIQVHCYNEQDRNPERTGAIIEIIINTNSYGRIIHQGRNY